MTRTVACEKCGTALQETDRFCASCGTNRLPTPTASRAPARPTSGWELVGDALRVATRGEFDIGGELGHGGMAAVFLAHDIALDKKVAIKVMAPTLMADAAMMERFLQEARTVARLEHPNIVTVHAARQAGGLNFFIMKFVEGMELEAILQRTGALRLAIAQAILYEVASALHYAHDRDVVHRDIKPSNIMVDTTGRAFVTDFGIAKLRGGKGLTMHGAAIGTPQYMSPEQCMAGPVSAASDQYSLGVVAYHLLGGSPPFNGEALTVMRAQVEDPIPPLERLIDGPCPADVRAAIARMLAKDPEARFPSVLQAVESFGARPLPAADPLRAEIARLVRTPDYIPPTAVFTTPYSPAPAVQRPESDIAVGAPPRPTTPSLVPPPADRSAARKVSVPEFDALRVSGAPRTAAPGASFTLRAEFTSESGASAPAVQVAWESSDLDVATIDGSGRVRVVGPGQAAFDAVAQGLRGSVRIAITETRPIPWRLMAAAMGGVTVAAVIAYLILKPPTNIATLRIEPASASITVGTEASLTLSGAPEGTSPAWQSSDSSVAIVRSGGRVTGVGQGTAEITAEAGGRRAVALVRVDPAEQRVASVRLQPQRANMLVGQQVPLGVQTLDERNAPITGRTVAWSSSDDGVATVSGDGVVSAVAQGSAQILAVVDGVRGVAEVRVATPRRDGPPGRGEQRAVAVVTVLVSPPQLTLEVGSTGTLSATPRDVQGRPLDREVAWRSEDNAVARVSPIGEVTAVAAGRAQVVATSEDVTGATTVTVRAQPVRDSAPVTVTRVVVSGIVAGGRHTCVQNQAGQVWCWGDNAAGQVRAGAASAVAEPASLDRQMVHLAAGAAHTCGLRDGVATCWGSNSDGQLASPDRKAREVTTTDRRFGALAAGAAHTCGVASDGTVACWGRNDFGQLGDKSTTNRSVPTKIAAPGSFAAITAGARHSCALRRDGVLLCWGDNWSGQVGSGMTQAIPDPTEIGGSLRFANIAAGEEHTCGAARDGHVYCWGQNSEGQLGDGTKRARNTPAPVGSSESFGFVAVGARHSCALARGGQSFCWGRGREGQLGNGAQQERLRPTATRTPDEFLTLAAGERHTCGLTKLGHVMCWGANGRGQLGTGSSEAGLVPSPIIELRP